MSLDGTRAGLKETVKNWLIRPADTDIDPFMDDWIKLGETRFNREQMLRSMIAAGTMALEVASDTPGRILVPSNFKKMRAITVYSPAPQTTIYHVSPDVFERLLIDQTIARRPDFVAIINEEFNFWPLPDQDYTLAISYWAKLSGLSDTVDTNWLLTNAPDVYLFGTLVEACAHLEDTEQLTKWELRYQNAIARLVEDDKESTRSSSIGMLHFSDLPVLGNVGRYNINIDDWR